MDVDQKNKQEPVHDFYLKYYVGHRGKFGHEFLEFEIDGKSGRLRYSNNSNYRYAWFLYSKSKRELRDFIYVMSKSLIKYLTFFNFDYKNTIKK